MARYVEQVNSLLHQQKSSSWCNFAVSVCDCIQYSAGKAGKR